MRAREKSPEADRHDRFDLTRHGRDLKGEWTPADGRLCTTLTASGAPACGDARMRDGTLYIKRPATGEVIKYLPK